MNPKRLGYSHFVALILSILTISSINLIHFGFLAKSATPESSESSLQTISKIQEPISISSGTFYRDGGTVFIRFTDATGRFFSVGIEPARGGTRGQIFINASHPSERTAIRLKIGSLEDTLILNILRDWLQQNSHNNKTEYVVKFLINAGDYRQNIEESNSKRIVSEQEALKLAEQLSFPQYIGKTPKYRNALIRESETTFEVKFVGVKIEANGKNGERDINVNLSKSTGKMLQMITSELREVQKDEL